MSSFKPVPDNLEFPSMEAEILKRWKETKAFERSLELAKEENRERFTFFDGPPFATGLPHYGHILAGTIKDVVTRYASLNGKYVPRRFGWDTHGLPVEFEIDKKLGIKSSDDVYKMGIKKYNAECRSIVTRYTSEWQTIVKRMGRWIDMENDYKTLEPWYMESVWWVFKTIFEKGLVYKGFRVMPYSFGCTTTLSNFEATSNYKDVSDPAVVANFPLVDEPDVSFVAWTTTPWTLPSNLALCVGPEMIYVKIKEVESGKQYILAETRLVELYPKMKKKGYKMGSDFEILEKFKGETLKGKKYVPLFDYFKDKPNCFQVLVDSYVTEDSGTGIVHQAPGFGEDDYRVCMANGIVQRGEGVVCPVDGDGRFTEEVPDFKGQNVKEADEGIIAKLKANGRLVKKDKIVHSYPFCYRSNTPLIYRAVPAWFVKIDPIKEDLIRNNEKTYWVPSHVKEKRFANWLRDARDWNISRNRYWGTPLPIWASEDGEELVVIGSIAELEELTGEKVTDIHMDSIDHLTIPSKQGKGLLKRIPDVFDCWFESGSMPYAQVHYPFENKEIFEKNFPADFIAEGIDQTRGWFYTLLVLSTALFNKPPFKNLIVNGLVLAADGKKMSKSLKNYPDPMIVIDKYGADALRLYLINSPVVRAEELKFKEEGVLQNLKDIFIPWFHAYRFFVQNTLRCESTKGWKFDRNGAEAIAKKSENIMDRWIMAASHGLIKFVHQEMEAYRLYTVVPDLIKFIENLCNWYVKLNRTRMTGLAKLDASEEEQLEDTKNALSTMYTVLVTLSKLMAPFTPYFAEYLYQHLVQPQDEKEASVHFLSMPSFDQSLVNPEIEKNFNNMAEIINMNRLIRGNDIPVRRPLRELIIVHESEEILNKLRDVEHYIKGESNVWKVTFSNDEKKYCLLSAKLNGSAEKDGVKLGKRLGKKMGVINKAVAKLTHEQISNFQEAGTITIEDTVLEISDVFINRQPIIEKKSSFKGKVGLQSNLTILLDTTVDAETISGQISRDFVNRIQKQRKTSGLQVGDVVDIFYSISGGSPEDVKEIENALEKNSDSIRTILKRPIQKLETKPSQTEVLGESSAPIGTFHSETNGTEEASITVVIATPSV